MSSILNQFETEEHPTCLFFINSTTVSTNQCSLQAVNFKRTRKFISYVHIGTEIGEPCILYFMGAGHIFLKLTTDQVMVFTGSWAFPCLCSVNSDFNKGQSN